MTGVLCFVIMSALIMFLLYDYRTHTYGFSVSEFIFCSVFVFNHRDMKYVQRRFRKFGPDHKFQFNST
jgi:hypothetical protein